MKKNVKPEEYAVKSKMNGLSKKVCEFRRKKRSSKCEDPEKLAAEIRELSKVQRRLAKNLQRGRV
jgi:hypothetical protein